MVKPTVKTIIIAVGLAFGGVTLGAVPALMDEPSSANNGGGYPITQQRAEALRECNERAAPYIDRDWGVQQSDIYRSCMAEHGQVE